MLPYHRPKGRVRITRIDSVRRGNRLTAMHKCGPMFKQKKAESEQQTGSRGAPLCHPLDQKIRSLEQPHPTKTVGRRNTRTLQGLSRVRGKSPCRPGYSVRNARMRKTEQVAMDVGRQAKRVSGARLVRAAFYTPSAKSWLAATAA
jgi:hypothetical protein